MNDVQTLEASRRLAERLLDAPEQTDEARLNRLSRLLLSRDWAPAEQAILTQKLEDFRAAYADDAKAAKELITIGESCPNPLLPAPETAAWMLVASTALNLDATLNK
jgi:hypothetical protein